MKSSLGTENLFIFLGKCTYTVRNALLSLQCHAGVEVGCILCKKCVTFLAAAMVMFQAEIHTVVPICKI